MLFRSHRSGKNPIAKTRTIPPQKTAVIKCTEIHSEFHKEIDNKTVDCRYNKRHKQTKIRLRNNRQHPIKPRISKKISPWRRSRRESAATLRTKCYRHKNKNGFPVYFAFHICCFSHRISPIICTSPYTDFVTNLTYYCQKLQYLTSYLLHSATGHSSYPGVPQRVRSVYHKHK